MKKMWLVMFILFFPSCVKNLNQRPTDEGQQLIYRIWDQTAKLTGINPDTPMPEIFFLERDFYSELLEKNCSLYEGDKKNDCEEDVKEIDKQLKIIFGKDHKETYGQYLDYQWKMINENCGSYGDRIKKQCEQDKEKISATIGMALGRTYCLENRIEIFPKKISKCMWAWSDYYERNYSRISFEERSAFNFGVIAHEMLHIALYLKGIPARNHHQEMKDKKYMENLSDFISGELDTPKEGAHKELHIKSLERGIESEEAQKRIRERIKI